MRARGVEDQRRWCVIEVSDNGQGMDPATVDRCFEPFFTTKDRTKGTGLGLSTVYSVVTQAGGEITVDSALGEGTTFTIRLPQVTDDDRAAWRGGRSLAGSLRILVVDDEPDVRAIVRDLLELEGHEVIVAGNGEEALAYGGDPPDLLLTDVVMPGMRGTDLARVFAERYPSVRVVLMSSHVDDEPLVRDHLSLGTFLSKPFSGDQLLAALATAQGSKR